MTNSTQITLSNEQLAASVGAEVVLLGLNTGTYYGLEAVGAHIWNLLQRTQLFGDIVDDVLSEFDAEREVIIRDVSQFIKTLEAEGLVHLAESQIEDVSR